MLNIGLIVFVLQDLGKLFKANIELTVPIAGVNVIFLISQEGAAFIAHTVYTLNLISKLVLFKLIACRILVLEIHNFKKIMMPALC